VALTVLEETLSGENRRQFTLKLVSSRLTIRELIRCRIRQELARREQKPAKLSIEDQCVKAFVE